MQTVGLNYIIGSDFSNAKQAMDKFQQSVAALAQNVSTAFAGIGTVAGTLGTAFKPISDGAKNASQIVINESKARIQVSKEETASALNDSKIRIQSLVEEATRAKALSTAEIQAATAKANASKVIISATNEKIAASRAEQAASSATLSALRLEQAQARANAQAKRGEKDEYGKLVASVQELTRRYYNAAAAALAMGDNTLETAKRLDLMAVAAKKGNDSLKVIEAGAGRYQRNVGNYSGANNYLRQTIAQMSGEIPNFFQSLKIGFMSLSNNIQPIQFALAGLREENKKLIAAGEPTKSAFKTIAGALLGWQTLLFVGIGLVSAYGDKMVDFIRDLSTGATAAEKLARAQKEASDKMFSADQITKDYLATIKRVDQSKITAIETATKEIATVKQLQATMTDTNLTLARRKNAYDKLIAIYPQLNQFASEEKALTGGLADAINTKLIPALLKRAAVEGIQGAIVETYKAQADAMVKQITITDKVAAAQKKAGDAQKHFSDQLSNGTIQGATLAFWKMFGAQQAYNKISSANITNSAVLADTQKELPNLANLLSTAMKDLDGSLLGVITPASALEDKLKALNAVLKTQTKGTSSYASTKEQIKDVSTQLKAYSDTAINATTHLDTLTKSQNNLNAEFTQTERKLNAGVITAFQAMKENIATVTQHLDKLFKNGGTQAAIQQDINLLQRMNYELQALAGIDLSNKGPNLFGGSAEAEFHSYIQGIEDAKKRAKDLSSGLYDYIGIKDPRQDIKRREMYNTFDTLGIDASKYIDPSKTSKEQVKEGEKALDRLDESYRNFARGWGRLVTEPMESFVGAIFEGKNAFDALGESIKNIVAELAKAVIKAGLLSLIGNKDDVSRQGGFGGILKGLLGIGLKGVIPFLASGGIVTSPTTAMIGEAGPEAVIPLNKLGNIMGSQQVNVKVRGQIAGRVINLSGSNQKTWEQR